jgi:hypothetical protein
MNSNDKRDNFCIVNADTSIEKHPPLEQAIGGIDYNSPDLNPTRLYDEANSGDCNTALELDDKEEDNYRLALERIILLAKYFLSFLAGVILVYVVGVFVCCGKKGCDLGNTVFEIDKKPNSRSTCVTVRRYVGSLLIYIFYQPIFVGAMSCTFIRDSKGEGWGNHYILSLIAKVVSTFFDAFLVGATAQKKGGIVASIANIPNILVDIIWIYLIYKNIIVLKSNIGWSVSFVLAAISSVGLAYWGGEVGERKQNDQFEPNTILGIRPLHWSWLWFMGSAYLAFMFHVALRWCLIPGDSISGLLAFIPVIAYGFPMVVM